MSISYFVRYEGRAESPAAFLSYYREKHVPILADFPGIRQIILHAPINWRDPFPVEPDRFALIVQMIFDTQDELERALNSEPRTMARSDFAKLPAFHGLVYHQAALSEEVFRSGGCDQFKDER